MDISLFADPWEHIRLLSDGPRNAALVGFLERHAPGRRVLEIGCGSGLLSLVAARLGAKEVVAVEPTAMVEIARELARRNKLSNLTILEGRLDEHTPRPMDLVFSELLNADPFYEEVVQVSELGRRWLEPGGLLAPRRLRVWAAATRAHEPAGEVRLARTQIEALARRHGLDLAPLVDAFQGDPSHRYVSLTDTPVGPPVLLWDLDLTADVAPEDEVVVELPVFQAGTVGGALIWFEAELDEVHTLHNRPGVPSHWGQQVCAFAMEREVPAGGALTVAFELDDNEVHAVPDDAG